VVLVVRRTKKEGDIRKALLGSIWPNHGSKPHMPMVQNGENHYILECIGYMRAVRKSLAWLTRT
jgi:hypothetical protein